MRADLRLNNYNVQFHEPINWATFCFEVRFVKICGNATEFLNQADFTPMSSTEKEIGWQIVTCTLAYVIVS